MTERLEPSLNKLKTVFVRLQEFSSYVRLDLSEGLNVFYGLNGVGKSRLLNAIPGGSFTLQTRRVSDDGTINALWFMARDWSSGHESELVWFDKWEEGAREPNHDGWNMDDIDIRDFYRLGLSPSELEVGKEREIADWTLRLAFWVARVQNLDDDKKKRTAIEAIDEALREGWVRVTRTPKEGQTHTHEYWTTKDLPGWDVTILGRIHPTAPKIWSYFQEAAEMFSQRVREEGLTDEDEINDLIWDETVEARVFRGHLFYDLDALNVEGLTQTREMFGDIAERHIPDSLLNHQPVIIMGLNDSPLPLVLERFVKSQSYSELENTNARHDLRLGRGWNPKVEEHLLGPPTSPNIDPIMHSVCETFTQRANKIFELIFLAAPELRIRMSDPGEWRIQDLVVCEIQDRSGKWIPVDQASDTQYRLATIAIELATIDRTSQGVPLLIIDEPERGLHRLAELQLRAGLAKLSEEIPGIVTCVATHSPLFLRPDLASLHHVQRTSDGKVAVNKLTAANLNNARGLGISTTDLLQLTRTIVLVEGSHDEWVLNTLFGDEFEELGVRVLSIRGATKLQSAAEGQLLFDYTEANILVMLDNVDTEKCEIAWNNAIDAWNEQQGIPGVVKALEKTFPKKYSTESKAIVEFCRAAIEHGRRERISFQMLRKGDIEFYFDPSFFLNSEKFPDGLPSWATLRRDHKKASGNFKSWLEADGRAKFNRSTFKRAAVEAKRENAIPQDLRNVLESIKRNGQFG